MKTIRSLCICTLVLAAVMASNQAAENLVKQQMCGTWHADGRIIVNWTKQKNLPVMLTISSNASVSGKVGDATLVNGRFKRNRTAIGRKLNLATDYIVTGDLSGPIIALEGIKRSSVNIPLNFQTNFTFTGGLHTSGGKFGGRNNMILSATGFTFVRTNPASATQPK